MPRKKPGKWAWTSAIRREISRRAKQLVKQESRASAAKRKAIKLKLDLLEECFNKLGNVKFP